MAKGGVITLSMRELDRQKTIQAIVDGNLRPGLPAERLGLTDRQLRRIVARYRDHGAEVLVSGAAVVRVTGVFPEILRVAPRLWGRFLPRLRPDVGL